MAKNRTMAIKHDKAKKEAIKSALDNSKCYMSTLILYKQDNKPTFSDNIMSRHRKYNMLVAASRKGVNPCT